MLLIIKFDLVEVKFIALSRLNFSQYIHKFQSLLSNHQRKISSENDFIFILPEHLAIFEIFFYICKIELHIVADIILNNIIYIYLCMHGWAFTCYT